MKNLEQEGDKLTHQLFTIIDKTFITPLDKEDISDLTSAIDQVLDATYGTSDKLVLFRIQKPSPRMQEFVTLLVSASQENTRPLVNYIRGSVRNLFSDSFDGTNKKKKAGISDLKDLNKLYPFMNKN